MTIKIGDKVKHLYLESLGYGEVIDVFNNKHFNILVRWSRRDENGVRIEWSFATEFLVPLKKGSE